MSKNEFIKIILFVKERKTIKLNLWLRVAAGSPAPDRLSPCPGALPWCPGPMIASFHVNYPAAVDVSVFMGFVMG